MFRLDVNCPPVDGISANVEEPESHPELDWPQDDLQGRIEASPLHFVAIVGVRMIRKLQSGEYRLYSKKKDPKTGKRKNLGTFKTRAAAEKHERAVQYFKRAH